MQESYDDNSPEPHPSSTRLKKVDLAEAIQNDLKAPHESNSDEDEEYNAFLRIFLDVVNAAADDTLSIGEIFRRVGVALDAQAQYKKQSPQGYLFENAERQIRSIVLDVLGSEEDDPDIDEVSLVQEHLPTDKQRKEFITEMSDFDIRDIKERVLQVYREVRQFVEKTIQKIRRRMGHMTGPQIPLAQLRREQDSRDIIIEFFEQGIPMTQSLSALEAVQRWKRRQNAKFPSNIANVITDYIFTSLVEEGALDHVITRCPTKLEQCILLNLIREEVIEDFSTQLQKIE